MILIIAGHSRSGTSILNRLCNSHPQIAVTTELGSFAYLGSSYAQYCRSILKRWNFYSNRWRIAPSEKNQRIRNRIFNIQFFARFLWGLGLQKESPVSHHAVEASLRRIYTDQLIVGDKWPYYTLKLDELTKLEGVKCLVIYRDCRDVTSSFLNKVRTSWQGKEWIANLSTADKIAERWVDMINIMQEHEQSIHIIRYEELARDSQTTMESVGHWLNVDPQLFSADAMKSTSIGKYKTGLTKEELEAVMRVAGPTMARLNYI